MIPLKEGHSVTKRPWGQLSKITAPSLRSFYEKIRAFASQKMIKSRRTTFSVYLMFYLTSGSLDQFCLGLV